MDFFVKAIQILVEQKRSVCWSKSWWGWSKLLQHDRWLLRNSWILLPWLSKVPMINYMVRYWWSQLGLCVLLFSRVRSSGYQGCGLGQCYIPLKVRVQKRDNGRIWYGTKVFAKGSLDNYLMIVKKGFGVWLRWDYEKRTERRTSQAKRVNQSQGVLTPHSASQVLLGLTLTAGHKTSWPNITSKAAVCWDTYAQRVAYTFLREKVLVQSYFPWELHNGNRICHQLCWVSDPPFAE
jgi:hypothetical protein